MRTLSEVPLFSICIPTCETMDNLHRTLCAIDEVNSKGSKISVCISYNGKDFPGFLSQKRNYRNINVFYRQSEPFSVSAARNLGVEALETQWIIFLDDDVTVQSSWRSTLETLMEVGPRAVIIGGRVVPKLEGCAEPRWLGEILRDVYWSAQDFGPVKKRLQLADPQLIGANMICRRDFLIEIGGFLPIQPSEDSFICWEAIHRGFDVEYWPDLLVHHRIPPARTFRKWFMRKAWAGGVNFQKALWVARTKNLPVVAPSPIFDILKPCCGILLNLLRLNLIKMHTHFMMLIYGFGRASAFFFRRSKVGYH